MDLVSARKEGHRGGRFALTALALVPALAAVARAADHDAVHAPSEVTLVLQIVVVLLFGRLLGEGMERLGQPSVMGQLIAGILLGPSVFGAALPDIQKTIFPPDPVQTAMIDGISQIGILMLLLLTGMETDLRLVRRVGRAAVSVSFTGILIPFVSGIAIAWLLPAAMLPHGASRFVVALFLGTALSISSIKIVAAVVREMNFMRRDLGQIIVGSAILEDTAGWIIIAITLGIAREGSFDPASLVGTIVGVAGFLGLSLTVGRRLVFSIIRLVNDNFRVEFAVITAILVLMGAFSLITRAIGVHTVLGAFVAGILVGESPILTGHIEEQLRGLITAFFMPVFFGITGLSVDLTVLGEPRYLALTLGLIVIASAGKFAGAFAGGKFGGMSARKAVAIGCAMNARGSTEVIVASIGLSMGALTRDLFSAIVAMAVVTTMMMPPMLRHALRRVPIDEDEKRRLEREALDERGFVPKLERLLLAVDDSPAGNLASRLAGYIAGARGMPMTIMQFRDTRRGRRLYANQPTTEAKKGAKDSASAAMESETEPPAPDKVHLTTRVQEKPAPEAVAAEARKGFDLLLIGLGTSQDPSGAFSAEVARIVSVFDGPYAIVAGDAEDRREIGSGSRILVPVNGTDSARRAAEVAFAIARPTNALVVAFYVSAEPGIETLARRSMARLTEEGVLKDIVKLGERYDARTRTAIASRRSPDAAILAEANRGYDLVVMAARPRAGDELFFGNTATAVLTKRKGPTLILAV